MKRVNNADINFVINPSYVNLANFTIKFYTTNEKDFYIEKNQDDVSTRERQTGVGGVDYIVKLDWSDLITLGEGVMNYKITNNYEDDDRADGEYNTSIERTSNYYIDSNVTVSEEEAESYAQVVAELGDKIDAEIVRSESADTEQSLALNTEIETRQNQVDIIINLIQDISGNTYTKSETSGKTEIANALNDKADKANTYTKSETSGATEIASALSTKLDATAYTPTDLSNYYTKSEVYNKSEIDNKGYITDSGFVIVTNPNTAQTKVGLVNSLSQYYNTNIGNGAVIEGDGDTNVNIIASGNYSHAEGIGTQAIGDSSHAEGNQTIASGAYSHAEGNYTTASGAYAHAEGYVTEASGNYSHAEGNNTVAVANYSHAEGCNTVAVAKYSHAEGNLTQANGQCSHAEGHLTMASGDSSHAEGYYTVANNDSEHASGRYNVSSSASTTFGDSGNTLFSVGNGTTQTRHNAFEIRQNGDIYITSGSTDIKLQDNLGGGSIDPTLNSGSTNAVANSAITNAFNTYTINKNNDNGETRYFYWATPKKPNGDKIISNFSINGRCPLTQTNGSNDYIDKFNLVETSAVTSSVTSASTDSQIPTAKAVFDAIPTGGTGGGKAVSGGTNISISTGETADTINCTLPISAGTNQTQKGIIVGDSECSSTGYYSIAFGHNADATGNYSFAMGSNCTARGSQSMRFGQGKIAAGDYSIALGYYSETNKRNQISLGCYISPKNEFEVGVGCWNNSVTASTTFGHSGNTLFSVGNGTDTSARHNAFEIRQNGDIYITSGSTEIKLQDHLVSGGGSSTPIVILTQSEYDDLATKDDNTVYIIK